MMIKNALLLKKPQKKWKTSKKSQVERKTLSGFHI